jgi:hypothetical protein
MGLDEFFVVGVLGADGEVELALGSGIFRETKGKVGLGIL